MRISLSDIDVGSVIQIDPVSDARFGGCFAIVDEVKKWGVQCYVKIPGKNGVAYYRAQYAEITWIGHAEWMLENTGE